MFLGFTAIVTIAPVAWPVDARPREEDRGELVQLHLETDGANRKNSENGDTDEATSRWHGLAAFVFKYTYPTTVTERQHVEERAALEALYDATGGDDWTNGTHWKTDAPLSEWYGVRTDAAGRVTRLDLGNNGLTGSVPPVLGSLANLEWLDLGFNDLTGPVPAELGNLGNLWSLSLFQNGLTGPIPGALGNLVNLRVLALGGTS